MLQLKNNTPFSAAIALFPNEQGIDTLYTIVKASFKIGPQWTLLEEQQEPGQEDIYWGEPGASSIRSVSDYHTGKASTDILVSGHACALNDVAVRQLDVSVQVGSASKIVRVFGDRVWNHGQISPPQPFTSIPLVYERAFGGVDRLEDEVRAAEERNPVGVGFAGKKKQSDMDGIPLPNLECPKQLIKDFRDTPAPACFAPVAPNWQPRIAYAGTYDENWQQTRAPFLPEDYSPRFMNSAHTDLIYPEFLQGGEPVRINGMHPTGELAFNLPIVKLQSRALVAGKEIAAPFNLETVAIDTAQLHVNLVWRSAFLCDKKVQKIEQVSVSMMR